MKTKKNAFVVPLFAAPLLMFAAGQAAAIDPIDMGLGAVVAGDTPGGAAPWVNAKFIDLGFLGAPGVVAGFAAFQNTVELQITTTGEREPATGSPFTAQQLADFGLSAYPDLGAVQGSGNLAAGQYVNQIYLNFNPALDLAKLQLGWSGAPGFGFSVPGAAPVSFETSENGFSVGDAGKFDILISFAAGALGPSGEFGSKLVFHYDGPVGSDANIDPSDFNFASVDAASGQGYTALGTVWGTTPGGITAIAAVPEPGTYAMLGLGILLLGFAVRRQQR